MCTQVHTFAIKWQIWNASKTFHEKIEMIRYNWKADSDTQIGLNNLKFFMSKNWHGEIKNPVPILNEFNTKSKQTWLYEKN